MTLIYETRVELPITQDEYWEVLMANELWHSTKWGGVFIRYENDGPNTTIWLKGRLNEDEIVALIVRYAPLLSVALGLE